MDLFLQGFMAIASIECILLIMAGVTIGIIFGAIPGMSATMAIALFLPITYKMEPITGIVLLIGLYIGGISGGLISAVLLKIPGTPSSIATTFDGSPMAANGQAGRALGIGIVFSFIGGIISLAALIFIAPTIASFALKFSTFEYFSISVFSITLIGSLSGDNIWKGLMSGFLGILLSMVGMAPIDGFPRFTFGMSELSAGFDILPVLIGLFAVAEIFVLAESKYKETKIEPIKYEMNGFGFSKKEFVQQLPNAARSGILGTAIGILPGIGGSVANVLAYIAAKKSSKYPEKFGTGIIDGIVASETANNAVTGGALIPLLTLGIPGDSTTAMLLGALTLHGITPGPLLFSTNGVIVYGIFAALLIANFTMVVVEFVGLKGFVKLLDIPKKILMPVIMVLCVVGAYGLNNRAFDAVAIVIFGIIGYILQKFKYPLSPLILGFILGPIIEENFRRSLMFSKGEFAPFFTNPISGLFLVLTFVSIVFTIVKTYKDSKVNKEVKTTKGEKKL